MKRILTSDDVLALVRRGETELVMGPEDRLTDLARELAQRRGVKLVDAAQAAARTAAVPQPAPRPAPAAPQPASVSRPAPAAPLRPQAAGGGGEEYDLVILGGTCVLPEMGCLPLNVCVRGGKIAALTAEVPRGRRVIDASGLYVLPGIIDPHTHLGLAVPFGQELESETRSAILGGVTTIGTYFNQPGSYLPVIDRLRREVSQLSRVDMIPHFSLREQQQIDELPLYSRQGMNSFKVYMCGMPGLYPHQEDGFIIRLMQRMKQLPPTAHPILSIHCENTSICDYATEDMQSQPLDTLADWNRTHPNLAEGEAVRRAAYFAREMGVRTYVVHSSTREAMEALAADKHPNLYVETTSPYLCLDTDSPIGAYGKMLPPIREPESRKALWDGIRSGLIDTIGTDNTVLTAGEKQVSSGMREAGAGYPTLGTHLVSVLDEGIFLDTIPARPEVKCAKIKYLSVAEMFAEAIVQRTMAARQEELNAEMRRVAEETWLNTRQVRELLNVCEGTLNLWAKRGYLVPVKVGNKNMYARSDVRRVQTGGKSESVTSYCKKRNG